MRIGLPDLVCINNPSNFRWSLIHRTRFRLRRVAVTLCTTVALASMYGFGADHASAETLKIVDTNKQSNFRLEKLWPTTNNNAAFFIGKYRVFNPGVTQSAGKMWRSSNGQTTEVKFRNPALKDINKIVGVTQRYVYFLVDENPASQSAKYTLWRTSVAGDREGTRRVKRFESDWQNNGSFGRTIGDRFILVVNLIQQRAGVAGRPKGVKVLSIRDDSNKLTDISRGLPAPGANNGLAAESGEIVNRKLYLFIGERTGRNILAPALWEINLTGRPARKVYQIPRSNNPSNRPVVGTTVTGNRYIYSRLNKAQSSNNNCRLWGFTGSSGNSGPLAVLSNNTVNVSRVRGCNEEMVIAYGDRLVFKHLDVNKGRVEIWETRGTPATTKKLIGWQVSRLSAKPEAVNVSLKIIKDRIWFTKRDASNRSEIWRSNSVVPGATIQFTRVWVSTRAKIAISIFATGNKPLIKVDDIRGNVSLNQMDASGRNFTPLIEGNGLISEVTTIGGQTLFGFKQRVGGSALFSLNLATGTLTNTENFHEYSSGIFSSSLRLGQVDMASFPRPQISEGKLYYCAIDDSYVPDAYEKDFTNRFGRHRVSLWRTDGTVAGTEPIQLYHSRFSCLTYTVNETDLFFSSPRFVNAERKDQIFRAEPDGSSPTLISNDSDDVRFLTSLNGAAVALVVDLDNSNGVDTITLRRHQGGNTWQTLKTHTEINFTKIVHRSEDRFWYVTRANNSDKYSLWVSDGTSTGTLLLSDEIDIIRSDSSPGIQDLLTVGEDTYFTGVVDGVSGLHVIKPGSGAQIVVETELVSGANEGNSRVQHPFLNGEETLLTQLGNRLYFVARHQLWRYDLTTDQSLVIESYPITADGSFFERYVPILSLEAFNGALYFIKQRKTAPNNDEWELLKTEGQPNSATLLLRQKGESVKLGNRSVFQKDANALWFIGVNRKKGHEVWRMTP